MADIIGVISTVDDDEYQGKAHKKVTLQTGQVLKVKYGREGSLKEKWGMLIPGTAIKFVMRDYQGKPFVADIESVKDSLPPPKQAQPHPTAQVPAQDMPQPKEITGQTIGMTTKEIGDMIRAKELTIIFGRDAAVGLIKWYRSQILGNTRIQYDGAKLPQFEKGE